MGLSRFLKSGCDVHGILLKAHHTRDTHVHVNTLNVISPTAKSCLIRNYTREGWYNFMGPLRCDFARMESISQQCPTVRKPQSTFISWSLFIPHKITVATKIETSCNGKGILCVCVCVCVWPLPVVLSQYFRGSRTPGDILSPSYWRVTWASIDSSRRHTLKHTHSRTHSVRGSSAKYRLLHSVSDLCQLSLQLKNPQSHPAPVCLQLLIFRRAVCFDAARSPQAHTETQAAVTYQTENLTWQESVFR